MMFLPTLLLYICVIAASRRIDKRVKIYFVYFWIQLGCLLIAWVAIWIVAVQSMGGGSSVNNLTLLYLPQIIIPVLVAVTFFRRLQESDKNTKGNEENTAKKISPTTIYEKIWQ